MARNIKISTIGPKNMIIDPSIGYQKIVERVIEYWKEKFEQVLPDKPDLIVVPEVCDEPFNFTFEQAREYYDVRKDRVLEYFSSVAKENNCYITYTAMRNSQDSTRRNSTSIIDRKGKVVGIYSKNHPTISELENLDIIPGDDAPVIDCDFGRVACATCFDLNFVELLDKYIKAKPDLLIFNSMYHGGLMQAYWAYACRSHFVSAIFNLPSEIRNPLGEVVASTTEYFDFATRTVNLNCCLVHLDNNRDGLKAMKEKYGSRVEITDPGHLASVLITCNDQKSDVQKMTEEFEIELLDDYLERARTYRRN